MAYQIGFDLYESATQKFLLRIQSALKATAPIPIQVAEEKKQTEIKEEKDAETMETDDDVTMETKEKPEEKPEKVVPKIEDLSQSERTVQDRSEIRIIIVEI